jgi:hypothetical protein
MRISLRNFVLLSIPKILEPRSDLSNDATTKQQYARHEDQPDDHRHLGRKID